MTRYLTTEIAKGHYPISHVVYLLEKMGRGDKITVEKEIGSGYKISVQECDVSCPKEFEG